MRGTLREYLEATFERYHRVEHLAPDPLLFLHRYERPDDVEVVGLIAALLAYGRVAQIRSSVEAVLAPLGPHPAAAVRRFDPRAGRAAYAAFAHRWSRGDDVVCLLSGMRAALEERGSLERLFSAGYRPGRPGAMRSALSALALWLRGAGAAGGGPAARPRGLPFLLPDAASGSACKRLNLFLRWMVRRDDPLDRGIWETVSPADLIMPLDTHVARISRRLGLSRRRTADWKMAEQVTAALSRFDPADPTRYDFSLCRAGILGATASRTRAPGASRSARGTAPSARPSPPCFREEGARSPTARASR
jgi:uncharacterized protein (TIGR02757 family)